MKSIFTFILYVISTEAVTEIALHSELWDKPRSWLMARGWFFKSLLGCGWCLSVWIAAGLFAVVQITEFTWILYVLSGHRLSNYIHLGFGIMKKKRWETPGPIIGSLTGIHVQDQRSRTSPEGEQSPPSDRRDTPRG